MQRLRNQQPQNPERSGLMSRNFSNSTAKAQQHVLPLNQLWLHLNRYPELKQLPLNPVSQPKDQLWRESPCTVRFPNRNISIDRLQRFRLGSIYHRDNINEQKKVYTESEKPELLLKNFRRQIQEASHSKSRYNRKFTQISAQKTKVNLKMGQTVPIANNKFYEIPEKIELKYDRNGTRSSFKGQYDVKKIIHDFRNTRPNFTSSTRIDLALPLNFNPGPGNYFIKSEELSAREISRSKRKPFQLNSVQKSQRQLPIDVIKQS